MEENIYLTISGVARDTHEKFPIRYDVAESGNSFFIGCTIESKVKGNNGNEITKRMDIRAFGDVADSLAHIQGGEHVVLKGTYDLQKSKKDEKYYPICTVTEVVEA